MVFQAGVPRAPTAGRRIGSVNKASSDLKKAVLMALDKLGGVNYLVKLGNDRPELFVQLLKQLLPIMAKLSVSDSAGTTTQINAEQTPREAMLSYMEALRDMTARPVNEPRVIEHQALEDDDGGHGTVQ